MNDFSNDHHRFDMQGTIPKLGSFLSVAYQEFYGSAKQARFYSVQEREGQPPRLILFWGGDNPPKDVHPIFAMNPGASQGFVRAWIDSLDPSEAGEEPDTDGSTEIGVRVYNEKWGQVANSPYAFVAIEPVWLVYGK